MRLIKIDLHNNINNNNLSEKENDDKLQLIKHLVSFDKIDVTAKDEEGKNPLHIASENGSLDVVKFLISLDKIDLTEVDDKGKNALYYACSNEEYGFSIVKYLISLDKIDLESKDNEGKTVLFHVIENENLGMFRLLQKSHKFDYDTQDKVGRTILHYACGIDNFDLVQNIISLGATTTIKDNEGLTILHCACRKGNLDIIKFLINQGEININEKDNFGRTPYAFAFFSEKSKVMKYLEGLPGIEITKRSYFSYFKMKLDSNKKGEEKEVEAEFASEKTQKENKIVDKKSQFEYGKKLFVKAIKYLKMSKQNGSEASSAFITKYIKDLNIEGIETLKENEEEDHND